MAKVSLTKLGLKVNQDIKTIEFNEQSIEVKQYLPINDKLELIANVVNASHDENNFANPVKISVFTTLEIMYAYTNINFTDKQKENEYKVYDTLKSNGLLDKILENNVYDGQTSTQPTTFLSFFIGYESFKADKKIKGMYKKFLQL